MQSSRSIACAVVSSTVERVFVSGLQMFHCLVTGPPVLKNFTTTQSVCENETYTFDLQAAGAAEAFPFPQEFNWTRHNENVDNTTDEGRVTYGYPSVTFSSLNRSDSGRYELSATNFMRNGSLIGSDTGSFTLDVQCKFIIICNDRCLPIKYSLES